MSVIDQIPLQLVTISQSISAASAQLVERFPHIRERGVGSSVATRFYSSNSLNSTQGINFGGELLFEIEKPRR